MKHGRTANALRLQQAWREFTESQQFQIFMTLNFNCRTTPDIAKRRLKDVFARLDSAFLGRGWYKLGPLRTLGFAFIENVDTNLHIHVVMKLPPACVGTIGQLQTIVERYWSRRVPSGSVVIKRITDLEGLARYVTKQFLRAPDDRIVISSEFHNAVMRRSQKPRANPFR